VYGTRLRRTSDSARRRSASRSGVLSACARPCPIENPVTRTICGLAVGSRIASMTACFGRQLGWPAWTWPCLLGAALAAGAFVVWERRLADHGGRPILDVGLFTLPGVGSGVLTVWLIMGGYGAFLLMLTLHLQGSLLHPAARRADIRDLRLRVRERQPDLDARAAGRARLASVRRLTRDGSGAARDRPAGRQRRLAGGGHGSAVVARRRRPRPRLLALAPQGSAHALAITTGVVAGVLVLAAISAGLEVVRARVTPVAGQAGGAGPTPCVETSSTSSSRWS
jgi:hypothetical protein